MQPVVQHPPLPCRTKSIATRWEFPYGPKGHQAGEQRDSVGKMSPGREGGRSPHLGAHWLWSARGCVYPREGKLEEKPVQLSAMFGNSTRKGVAGGQEDPQLLESRHFPLKSCLRSWVGTREACEDLAWMGSSFGRENRNKTVHFIFDEVKPA